jgi:hypothetical protein
MTYRELIIVQTYSSLLSSKIHYISLGTWDSEALAKFKINNLIKWCM